MRLRLFLPWLALVTSTALSADPGWWDARGVKNTALAANLAPVTIGQAKHMAAMALAELENKLPPATHQALAADLGQIVDLALPDPLPPDFYNKQRAILLTGQLKAMAKPFYDHLRAHDAAWLDNAMTTGNLVVMEPGSNPPTPSTYPWTEDVSDDANRAPATLGQLKAVFSLPLETLVVTPPQTADADGDGMPDWWEIQFGLNPTDPADANQDMDGDGATNREESAAQSNPNSSNSTPNDKDGDGLANAQEAIYATDPNQSDSDGDGVIDSLDGWAMDANLQCPRISKKYVLVDLSEHLPLVGQQESYTEENIEIDDLGGILYATTTYPDDFFIIYDVTTTAKYFHAGNVYGAEELPYFNKTIHLGDGVTPWLSSFTPSLSFNGELHYKFYLEKWWGNFWNLPILEMDEKHHVVSETNSEIYDLQKFRNYSINGYAGLECYLAKNSEPVMNLWGQMNDYEGHGLHDAGKHNGIESPADNIYPYALQIGNDLHIEKSLTFAQTGGQNPSVMAATITHTVGRNGTKIIREQLRDVNGLHEATHDKSTPALVPAALSGHMPHAIPIGDSMDVLSWESEKSYSTDRGITRHPFRIVNNNTLENTAFPRTSVSNEFILLADDSVILNQRKNPIQDLVSNAEGWSNFQLHEINKNGQIVGTATKESIKRIVTLLPFDIEGHKRGTIHEPGGKAPTGPGKYDHETVMMENADSEDNTVGLQDYDTDGSVDQWSDDDFIKVDLRWPKGIQISGMSLELKHTGMEVDPTKSSDAEKYKEIGPSRLNFYKPDGTKLTPADLKIDDLGSPGTGYLAEILNTGELTLFIEGAENFGNLGLTASKMKLLGGAILSFEVMHNGTTSRARLLVYRGGFLVFRQPKGQPGHAGKFEFWDGKGRVKNKSGGYKQEFQEDVTDWGMMLESWTAKSGKSSGSADYRTSGGKGYAPPGWWWVVENPLAVTEQQLHKSAGYIQSRGQANENWNQAAFTRWQQDDAPAGQRYTADYIYNKSIPHDDQIGPPTFVEYKFRLFAIPPSTAYKRTGLLIHPDGKKDGTLGCIGLQTWEEANGAADVLRRYRGLKLKVQDN